MAPSIKPKCKPKGGITAATKTNNPATVYPAAANNTAVVTSSTAKHSHLGHGTSASATANNTIESNLPTAVTVHPATANGTHVPSGGGHGDDCWQQ
jgi:hypothetical protein